MTEHHLLDPADPGSGPLVVTGGFTTEDDTDVDEEAALVFDHGDQCVIQGPRAHLAAVCEAAAGVLTRPDLDRWASVPVRPADGVLAAYRADRARLADRAATVARLLADTLTACLPDAAYLVLSLDRSHDRHDLDRVLDRTGATVHRFTGHRLVDRLPDLPAGHTLHTAWGGADPTDPLVLIEVVRMLDADGADFDLVPDLPDVATPAEQPCLLLAPGLPALFPEAPRHFPRLLRPYA